MATVDLAPFRAAIEERICRHCVDRRFDGTCARPKEDPCALVTHLDALVEAVLAVGPSDQISDYVAALRGRLCPTCHQDGEGNCALRKFVDCALDAYVLMVVQVIEETATRQGLLPATPGSGKQSVR